MRNKKKTKKRRSLRLFLITLFSVIGVFILVIGIALASFQYFIHDDLNLSKDLDTNMKSGLKTGQNALTNMLKAIPARTNFVIMCTDEDGTRTDFMMVGCYNSDKNTLDFISMPRDTYVFLEKDKMDFLKEKGRPRPSGGDCKLTELFAYAGKEYGIEFIVKEIEELLNIKVEFYVKIELEAFRSLIDEMGGIDFYVPQDMYYNDPEQHLLINLKEGQQNLNGTDAEGLLRYRKSTGGKTRSYPRGDLERVEVQQAFMKEVVRQLLAKENFVANATSVINMTMKYVKTNFNVADGTKYLKYVKNLKEENISGYTIPNYLESGYVMPDDVKLRELVDSIFYSSDVVDEKSAVAETSKDKRIQILNGGYTSGLAGHAKEKLEEKGFTVESTGDYNSAKKTYTRIIVKKDGTGKDLQEFFTDSKIEKDITMEYDIIIILGTDEK